ncbi:MAG: DinB family protein [Thermoanaerobaculia bacterium]|nr:DinB family protein [Thermoanaerobaculia bacterium]
MNDRLKRRFDRLEAVRHRIESSIDGLDSAALNRPPAPGRWSAAQVIGHLVKAESLSVAYIGKKASDPSKLRPAGIVHSLKSTLVVALMRVPMKFSAPEIVAEMPENASPNELRERWRATRSEMCELLDRLPDALLHTCLYKHPVAGPMTVEGALDFMIAHATRHAKQIDGVLRTVRGG